MKAPKTPLGIARAWLKARQIVNLHKPVMERLGPKVREWLKGKPDNRAAVDSSVLSLVQVNRRVFDLEKAEAALGKRVLEPYVKRVLDLKAAEEALGRDLLQPFIREELDYERISVG